MSRYVNAANQDIEESNIRYEELKSLCEKRGVYFPTKSTMIANGYRRELDQIERMLDKTS